MAATIVATKLTKKFGTVAAVDALNLDVHPGQVFGLIGPNGAGKTTTIRLLLGLIGATSGTAQIMGLDVWKERSVLHRDLGYVPAETPLWPNLTGSQMLELLSNLHGIKSRRVKELCERLDFDPTKRGREYSRGNRQKLALVAAFSLEPAVLILDEPATGLDPVAADEFRSLVRERVDNGSTVLLSSHMLDEVEDLCHKVGIMRTGSLLESKTIDELKGLQTVQVEIEFVDAVPQLGAINGADSISIEGRIIRFSLDGPIQRVLDELAGYKVQRSETRSASLRDAVLSFYDTDRSPS